MSNPLKQFINQFNKYPRSDRNAIILLSSLILILLIAKTIYKNIDPPPGFDAAEYEKMFEEIETVFAKEPIGQQSLFQFNPNTVSEIKLDSLNLPQQVKSNIIKYRNAGGRFTQVSDLRKIYGMNDSLFSLVKPYIEIEKQGKPVRKTVHKEVPKKNYSGNFDPNKVSLEKLREIGFSNYQANNLVKYRNRGGVFYSAADVSKIYGIDSLFFLSIEKQIRIPKQFDVPAQAEAPFVYRVELNKADSASLVALHGIGPVYAVRILKYRKLLGGYYSKRQLLEVYNLPDETFAAIEKNVLVDSTQIEKIRINFVEYNDLLRHPYLNRKQTKALLNYRDKNGAFEDIAAIQMVAEIDSVTYSKIKHYITCR